jgi:hypothetical protein
MTLTHSKSRHEAEIAFDNTQSRFFAKGSAVEELESVTEAREAKTLRLREARLAMEATAIATVASALVIKRTRKS